MDSSAVRRVRLANLCRLLYGAGYVMHDEWWDQLDIRAFKEIFASSSLTRIAINRRIARKRMLNESVATEALDGRWAKLFTDLDRTKHLVMSIGLVRLLRPADWTSKPVRTRLSHALGPLWIAQLTTLSCSAGPRDFYVDHFDLDQGAMLDEALAAGFAVLSGQVEFSAVAKVIEILFPCRESIATQDLSPVATRFAHDQLFRFDRFFPVDHRTESREDALLTDFLPVSKFVADQSVSDTHGNAF